MGNSTCGNCMSRGQKPIVSNLLTKNNSNSPSKTLKKNEAKKIWDMKLKAQYEKNNRHQHITELMKKDISNFLTEDNNNNENNKKTNQLNCNEENNKKMKSPSNNDTNKQLQNNKNISSGNTFDNYDILKEEEDFSANIRTHNIEGDKGKLNQYNEKEEINIIPTCISNINNNNTTVKNNITINNCLNKEITDFSPQRNSYFKKNSANNFLTTHASNNNITNQINTNFEPNSPDTNKNKDHIINIISANEKSDINSQEPANENDNHNSYTSFMKGILGPAIQNVINKEEEEKLRKEEEEGLRKEQEEKKRILGNRVDNLNIIKKLFIYQLKKKASPEIASKQNNSILVKNNSSIITLGPQSEGIEQQNNNSIIEENNLNSPYFIKWTKSFNYEVLTNGDIKINDFIILMKNEDEGEIDLYKCYNVETKKTLGARITKKTEFVIQFFRIFRNYKFIIKIYQILEHDDNIYILCDYIQESIDYDRYTGFEKWKYFRNIVSAVEYFHKVLKVVHRNINPKCCLIDESNSVRLSGFSKCYILQNNSNEIEYETDGIDKTNIPPEVTVNKQTKIDGKKVDIWCLGNILIYLLYNCTFLDPEQKDEYTKESYLFTKDIGIQDQDLFNLLSGLLSFEPNERFDIDDVKKNGWVTQNNEFPMPDLQEETLDYYNKVLSINLSYTKNLPQQIQKSNYI